MATLYGTNWTTLLNTTPALPVAAAQGHGRVRVLSDVIELAAASIADIMVMGLLPPNATVLSAKAVHDNLGASTTLALGSRVRSDGSSADPDRFQAAEATSAAGTIDMDEGEIDSGFLYQTTVEEEVYFTLAGGAATGTVKLVLKYVVD